MPSEDYFGVLLRIRHDTSSPSEISQAQVSVVITRDPDYRFLLATLACRGDRL
jgi:hypothetical protein